MPALLDMNTSPAEPEQAERKPTMRFQYPSGAKPLDGYTIKRGVGRGGFGEVYFAVSDAGKEVALKLIRRNLEVELRGVTHCLNLKHPNLIDVYDIRTDEHDDRWVIMEYVAGASLEDMVARHAEGMPRDMAMHWFDGICAGVAYLHDHGIVHRDLKPANIFLDDGRVKIGDYGLSKFISCSRRSGQTESVGTVHYMAPEIANGRYGREIDAYALGIILYEMLTGRVPFEGESVGEVLMKHLTAEPELSRLEEPFRSVVRGAMAKDPERRINSAAEMAAILRGTSAPTTPLPAYSSVAPTIYYDPNSSGGATGRSAEPKPRDPAGSPWYEPQSAVRTSPATRELTPGESIREFFHREPEPLFEGIRLAVIGAAGELKFGEWPAVPRFAASLLLVFMVLVTWPVWIAGIVGYLVYRFVRLFVQVVTDDPRRGDYLSPRRPTHPAPAAQRPVTPTVPPVEGFAPVAAARESAPAPAAPAPQPRRRRRNQATWRFAAYSELASRPMRTRMATILSSLLAAAAIAPIATLLVCMFAVRELSSEVFIWSAIVTTVASWAVIVPAQLTEGRLEDQAPLRFTMMLLGGVVGIVAWGVANLMYFHLPVSRDFGFRPEAAMSGGLLGWRGGPLSNVMGNGQVNLPLPMYTAYFAFLFLALRWWRQAEWTRPSRVSIWATAWTGAVGFFVSMLWWFPQPLGIVMAAVISFTVQLASPWVTPSRRKQFAQVAATSPGLS